jgi:type VI secretion system VasD/TssJ family lipoprotein
MNYAVRLCSVTMLAILLSGCANRFGTWPAVIEPEPKHSRLDAIEWVDGLQSWQPSLAAEGEPLPVAPPEAWIFEKRSMVVRLKSLADLNVYQEKSHALLVNIFQMADPAIFNKLRAAPDGLQALLAGKNLDPSLLSLKQVFLQPGKSEVVVLDREQTTQFIGIVAGYYDLNSKLVSRVIPIPAIVDKPVGRLAILKSKVDEINPFAEPPPLPRPSHLKVWIDFGATQIEMLDMRAM